MATTRREQELTSLESELYQPISHTQPMTEPASDELKGNSPLTKLALEVDDLERAMNIFPYRELRSIEIEETKSNHQDYFTHASANAISQLLAMFSDTFFYSGSENVASFLKETTKFSQEPKEKETVLKLANILLNFKQKIAEVENAYFAKKMSGSNTGIDPAQLAQLRTDSTWVLCFHYIIERHLDTISDPKSGKPFSKRDYAQSINNIKKLCEATYGWIAKNVPGELEKYRGLQPKASSKQLRKPLRNTTNLLLTTLGEKLGAASEKSTEQQEKFICSPPKKLRRPSSIASSENCPSGQKMRRPRVRKRKIDFSASEHDLTASVPFSLEVSAQLPQTVELPENSSSLQTKKSPQFFLLESPKKSNSSQTEELRSSPTIRNFR